MPSPVNKCLVIARNAASKSISWMDLWKNHNSDSIMMNWWFITWWVSIRFLLIKLMESPPTRVCGTNEMHLKIMKRAEWLKEIPRHHFSFIFHLHAASESEMKLLKFNQSENQRRTHKYECVLSSRWKCVANERQNVPRRAASVRKLLLLL